MTITTIKMSDSELSDLPPDHESYSQIEEPLLPLLIPQHTSIQPSVEAVNISLHDVLQHPIVVLPLMSSKLFTKGLYHREILDTQPPTIRMACLQPNYNYSIVQGLQPLSMGNLWRHYSLKHPAVSYALKKGNSQPSRASSSISSFFSPCSLATSKPK